MAKIEFIKTEVGLIDLKPGDIIVLTYGGNLSNEDCAQIKQEIASLAPGHKILLLEGGVRLQILRSELP